MPFHTPSTTVPTFEFVVTDRYGNVEVAVVEVAVKYSATVSPTTDSFAYGEVVPMPKFPVFVNLPLSEPAV